VSGGSSSSARRASVSVSAEDVSPVKKELGGSNATEQLKLFLREVFKAFGNCDKAFIEEQVHSRTQAIGMRLSFLFIYLFFFLITNLVRVQTSPKI